MNQHPVMTIGDFAAAVRRSPKTIRRWNRLELTPEPLKPAGQLLWRTADVLFWIESGMPNRQSFDQLKATRDRFARA